MSSLSRPSSTLRPKLNTKVFVRDEVYAWLPGEVVATTTTTTTAASATSSSSAAAGRGIASTTPPRRFGAASSLPSSLSSSPSKKSRTNNNKKKKTATANGGAGAAIRNDGGASSGGDDDDDEDDGDDDESETVTVAIVLPDDWSKFTFMHDHKSLHGTTTTAAASAAASSLGGRQQQQHRLTRTVRLSDYAGNELPLQNVDDVTGQLLGKSDMADLPHLHEAAILYNLKDRHSRGVPYTRVGDIVVAVNPYQWIDGLYSTERRALYAERIVWDAQQEDMSNRQSILKGYFDRIMHDPHVYETSAHAYAGLMSLEGGDGGGSGGGWGRDQAILVSGESGAGKTETVKIVMTHLATMASTAPTAEGGESERTVGGGGGGDEAGSETNANVVKKILRSNPLFEAFGNAKTVTNDNSSRFGKFTKLHFSALPDGGFLSTQTRIDPASAQKSPYGSVTVPVLAGSSFETYLLEKSRVVSHDQGERTYHFFYQLLSAPDGDKAEFWDGLVGTTCESFRYVGMPDCGAIEGKSDADAWAETKSALLDFGFEGEAMSTFMRAACAVLQLGNLTFVPDPSVKLGDEEGAIVSNSDELEKLSTLMGVPCEELTAALTSRLVKTQGEEIVVRLSPAAAKDGSDALAKEIYNRVFAFLVDAINKSTKPPLEITGLPPQSSSSLNSVAATSDAHCISILDMFGFESFAVNRFEQLCINYANERIQNKYATDTFLSIREEYEAEGIQIYDFSQVDNSDVLALVEGRTGLIMVLNEECVRPKGNDESFVYKIKSIHKESDRLVSDLLHRPCDFAIRHFAGTVKYDAAGFVERNTDQLPKGLLNCAIGSSNSLIKNGFKQLASDMEEQQSNYRRKRSANTICTKFKSQLTALMNDIKDSRTRYIRCIKPNRKKIPFVMDHQITMRQLASAGLVTAITVSRETFPNRLPFEVVWDRFQVLLPGELPLEGVITTRQKAEHLLDILLEGKEKVVGGHVIAPFACGTTKVFFRSGSLELLESNRLNLYSAKATTLQRRARGVLTRQKLKRMNSAAVKLQAQWRRYSAQKEYAIMHKALLRLQSWGRHILAIICLLRLRKMRAAEIIQSFWRAQEPQKVLNASKKAARIIQHAVRSKKDQNDMKSSLAVVVEEAHMDHKMKMLLSKLEEPSGHDKDTLIQESAKIIEYLSKQLYMQRTKTWNAKAEIEKERSFDSRKSIHNNSIQAALAANKLEVTRLRQTNMRLESQLSEFKADKASTRKIMKTIQEEFKAEKSMHEQELGKIKTAHAEEVNKLKADITIMKKNHETELAELVRTSKESEEKCELEIARLKEEIQKSEESYEDDVAKVLDALQMAHEEDTRRRKPAENEEELKRRLQFLEQSYESELRDLKENLCLRCKAVCQNRGLMSSPELMRSMGSLSRSLGTRNLF